MAALFGLMAAVLGSADARATGERVTVSSFAGSATYADDVLAAMRGGFEAPFGLEIEFGAFVRTLVDGRLVMERVLAWGGDNALWVPSAALVRAEENGPALAVFSLDPASVLSASGIAGASMLSSDASGVGLAIGDADGAVAGFARVAPGMAVNLLAAMGSNQEIDQRLDLVFSVQGLAALQGRAGFAATANWLSDALTPR